MYLFTMNDRRTKVRSGRFSRFRATGTKIRKKNVVELRPGRTGPKSDGEMSPGRATK